MPTLSTAFRVEPSRALGTWRRLSDWFVRGETHTQIVNRGCFLTGSGFEFIKFFGEQHGGVGSHLLELRRIKQHGTILTFPSFVFGQHDFDAQLSR